MGDEACDHCGRPPTDCLCGLNCPECGGRLSRERDSEDYCDYITCSACDYEDVDYDEDQPGGCMNVPWGFLL